jgi:ubiquinone/menaquinone biosynthesis C-methylase UbiE
MKRNILLTGFTLYLTILFSSQLFSQDADQWEEHQTSFQPPEIVIKAIGLKEGMVVGEIGAGKGRYSVILAEKVGGKGHIYANDIDKESLEYLDFRCKRDGIENITTILGREKDPLLPENELDMIFIVNTYHHISNPVHVLKNAYPALKSSGTLVIIEGVPGKYGDHSDHVTSKEILVSQMKEADFRFEGVIAELKRDNIYLFRKSR